VYVTLKTSASATEYRSEVVAGLTEYDETTLGYAHWVTDVFLVKLHWERVPYWEATTAVQLEVSNHLVTNDTSGAPVHNPTITATGTGISFTASTKTIADTANGLAYFLTGDTIHVRDSTSNDGAYTVATGGVAGSIVVDQALTDESAGASVAILGQRNNYLEIAAAQVGGVVNAPVRLELTNAAGEAVAYKDMHVGVSRLNNVANFIFTLEAAAGTGGTETDDAACNKGNYNAITWAGDSEVAVWTYTLTAAMLAASRGAYFIPIVRLNGGTIDTTIALRLNIKLSTTTVHEGALITLAADNYMQALGLLQLPPYLERITAPAALTLSLRAKKTGGGALNLDFIQLVPVDAYRHLKQLGYSVADGDSIYIDELIDRQGYVYGVDSSAKNYQVWLRRGAPLMVQPSTKQRIYLLYDESDSTQNIGRKMTAKLYYRPRRLSL